MHVPSTLYDKAPTFFGLGNDWNRSGGFASIAVVLVIDLSCLCSTHLHAKKAGS